ncbi:baseplate tail tube cap [Acidovorax phage ACP17]|uniref:Putative tail tube associated base plate protein n=1 Tax=Acidovorax phage ACP17 TaxID=2010329 RepID=A0A218M3F8_9CAUD|nr:baseplate tail tube cap [Acidovorax phage ACP17]ASD50575.1 putative tail tube associated base plate protein [Acidovorax phage ACP17]
MASYFYPAKLQNENLHPAWMEFNFFERKSAKESKPDDIIQLYMPESASQPSTVSWDTEKFGVVGTTIVDAANNGTEGLGGNVWDAGRVAGARAMANLMSSAASRLGGQVSAEGLMGATQGRIPNPYLTMVFRGVDFRNYSFAFKFFPFSQDDCVTIDNIVKTFRANALPPGKAGDPFLGYPKEVQVAYKWKGQDNPWLHKFKRSVITGVDVDYTPNGMFSVMRNGMPSQINLVLKLSEIEIVLRDDVMQEGF